jgi:hypothetical protein
MRLLVQVAADRLGVRHGIGRGGNGEHEREGQGEDRQPADGAPQARHQRHPESPDEPGRQPCRDDTRERLVGAAREPLQRQRVGEARARLQHAGMPKHVEPPDSSGDRGEHDGNDGGAAREMAGGGANCGHAAQRTGPRR